MTYGTLAWARRTGGHLSGLERARQTLLMARAQAAARLHHRPDLAGLATPAAVERALATTDLPDTPAVLAVSDLIARHERPSLVQHSWRTYLFGRLFALRDGLEVDAELLALASLLHDLALDRRDHSRTCFAHDGAEQALDILAAQGIDADRRALVADAICLHLRVEVPAELGTEAHLLHAGAALDVVGSRLRDLPAPVLRSVLERRPRLDLVDALLTTFGEQEGRHPQARISHWMSLGFGPAIRANPLDRLTTNPLR